MKTQTGDTQKGKIDFYVENWKNVVITVNYSRSAVAVCPCKNSHLCKKKNNEITIYKTRKDINNFDVNSYISIYKWRWDPS